MLPISKVIIFIGLAFSLLNYAKSDDKLVTITGSPWQPFYGKDLPGYGLVSQIVKESYKRTGYKVKFFFLPWARCLLEIEAGRLDATAIAYYTEERAKKFYYSDPFMDSPLVFFKRVDSNISWRSLRDLQSYRIGVGIDIAYSPTFDKASFLEKVEIPDDTVNLQKIALKRIDIAPLDKYVGIYYLNNKYPHLKNKIEYMLPPLHTHKLYVLFSRKIPNPKQKIKAFNDGYKAILKDGTYQSILKEYTSIQINNGDFSE